MSRSSSALRGLAFVVGFAMLALIPARGEASPIKVFSDSMTVFKPGGDIFAQIVLYEDGTFTGTGKFGMMPKVKHPTSEDPEAIYYVRVGVDTNVAPTFLTEGDSGTGPYEAYSDVFGAVKLDKKKHKGTFGALAFMSDSETGTVGVGIAGANVFPEGNGIFDATKYLSDRLQDEGYTAQFKSDPEVPEPATLSLLGLGLALGAVRLRRRR